MKWNNGQNWNEQMSNFKHLDRYIMWEKFPLKTVRFNVKQSLCTRKNARTSKKRSDLPKTPTLPDNPDQKSSICEY